MPRRPLSGLGTVKKTADRIGPELLGKTCVSEAISKAIRERQERTKITQDKVIDEIAKNAFKDASDASDSDFKHTSKAKYLDMLCKHLGVYDKMANAVVSSNNLLDAIRDTEVDTDEVPEAE